MRSLKNVAVEVQLSSSASRFLKQLSVSHGRTPGELLGQYVEEITRQHRFCHIEFRASPLGRMAYVTGTRTPVWLLVDLCRQQGGDARETADLHEWPETAVRAALNYAKAFPEEIEPLIERAHQISEDDLKQLNAA